MKKNKKYIKLLLYFVIAVIIFFLAKIKNHQFSFNYYYLCLSFLLYGLSLGGLSFVWNKILRKIEPSQKLRYWQVFMIYIYSEFGRYVPGKIWTIAGKIYLGSREGINKKKLLISSFLDSILAVLATLLLGIFFLIFYLGHISPYIYLAAGAIIIFGFIIIYPGVFYPLFNLILKEIKKEEISTQDFLSYREIFTFFLHYLTVAIIRGGAFFF